MDQKLTEEQKQIVEDNHNLIYWYINHAGLNFDEWYDLLAIEMCYAAMKYDKTRGSFSTYFKMRADCLVYREIRKTQSQKRHHLEIEHTENPNFNECEFMDTIEAPDNTDLEVQDFFNGENGQILKLRYEGYSQSEIAKKIGCSQSHVSLVLKKTRGTYDFNR